MKIKLYHIFIMLVILIVILPVFRDNVYRIIILNALYTLIFIVIMYNFIKGREHPLLVIAIGGSWIVFGWLAILLEHVMVIQLIWMSSMTLFFGYTAVSVFRYIAKSEHVDSDTLFGAACIYILLGLTWTGVYTLVEVVRPLSLQFSGDSTTPITRVSTLIYYSFTTLTTLGYGDINPMTSLTQSLAILEAMTGVLYMALIIGLVVGIYGSSTKTEEQP
jgi:hypothetical protein